MEDADFVSIVRRYTPSTLVPLLARVGSARLDPEQWSQPGRTGFGTPWSLAEISRVSLAAGNEFRNVADERSVIECTNAFNALDDPQFVGDADDIPGLFLRLAAEQFPFQLPLHQEMSRSVALLSHTTAARDTEVIQPGWDADLFGCDLQTFVAAGQLLHISVAPNGGVFDPTWLDSPAFDRLWEFADRDSVRQAMIDNYVISADEFKKSNGPVVSSPWRRYEHNPLVSRPVISGLTDQWIIPSAHLLVWRLSPLGIYHAGVERHGTAFSRDLGYLFEPYIGDQLSLIPDAQVFRWGQGTDGTEPIDFVVVLPEVVVLVEVKSTRPTEVVRAGKPEWAETVRSRIGKAIRQLERDDALIEAGDPLFDEIPTDRPRVGLVVTMEDFHLLNSGFHAPVLDRTRPDLPISIASAGEVETWVALAATSPGSAVLETIEAEPDDRRSTFSLSAAFRDRPVNPNPILLRAWESGPWDAAARAYGDETDDRAGE
ncbi:MULTISPECIES: hypothetical protein [unclassified Aeromicrobium]|jgi:hypothetical protein|uniref:hypothetical protein n=1 Tax=unclassified Aeromicrobium TaxID=2633570 RepID=UPI000A96FE5F|nr:MULTISPECIES: hypothetical protein [unclassified Aeromicrobium]